MLSLSCFLELGFLIKRSEIKAAVNLDLPGSSWELEELYEVTNTTVVVDLLPQNKVQLKV